MCPIKRWISVLLIVLIIFSSSSAVLGKTKTEIINAQFNNRTIKINGLVVRMDNFHYKNITYVPLLTFAAATGKAAKQDPRTNTVDIVDSNVILNLDTVKPAVKYTKPVNINVVFNSIQVKINGKPLKSDNILYSNTTYIQLNAAAALMEKDAKWTGNTTVDITDKIFTIVVDPRWELFRILNFLNGKNTNMTPFDFSYKNKITAYFEKYKAHDAVKKYNASYLFDRDDNFLVFQMSSLPEISVNPEMMALEIKDEQSRYLEQVRDFIKVSGFMKFYETNQEYYNRLETTLRNNIKNDMDKYVKAMMEYFGDKSSNFKFMFCPVNGGAGWYSVKKAYGKTDRYAFSGPLSLKNDEPSYFMFKEHFAYIAWHEFGHSYGNPLVDKFGDELEKYSELYKPIEASMKVQGYDNWRIALYEHITRAVDVRLAYIMLGKEWGDKCLNSEIQKKGAVYVPDLCKQLEVYEKSRDKYPTFESFFPEIVKVFKELSMNNQGAEKKEAA